MRIHIENETWRYRIPGSKLGGFILLGVLILAFSGVSLWLYTSNNGGWIFTAFFALLLAAAFICGIYRYMFVKILVGTSGFYHQTRPGNGTFYPYTDILKAWSRREKTAKGGSMDCFYFQTPEGKTKRFLYMPFDEDEIEFLLLQINGEAEAAGEEENREE